MKKILLFLFVCIIKISFAQTNIAVPNYSALSNGLPSTGKVNFYLNGSGFSTNVGHGANAVAFYEENMFVAYDDGTATGNGILWYKDVSFATGAFVYSSVVILNTNQRTLGVVADVVTGDIYVANYNGTITRFIRQLNAPFYTTAATTSMTFWSGGNVAEASGLYVDVSTRILWAVSSANNQAAVCKLSTFGTANTIKYITGPTSPINFIQKPQGISEDGSGNMWIANNTNNEILKINIATVNAINNELNANDYTPKVLTTPANIQNFSVGVSTYKLGGLAYDYQYANKMFVNSQLSTSSGNPVYEFNPSLATPIFSPSIGLSQVFPGIGQAGIIPCTILAPPPTPMANGITVNPGQTATLTATGCGTDQTYIWRQFNNVKSYSASYTTLPITTNSTYTVSCVRGLGCESLVGRDVVVNNPLVISSPLISNVAVPRLTQDSVFFYLGNTINPTHKYKLFTQTPNGIHFFGNEMFLSSNSTTGAGTVNWYPNVSFNPYNFTGATTPTYLVQIYNNNGVSGTTQVVTDDAGNIYAASKNGIITKFYRNTVAPFYSNQRQVGVRVGTNSQVLGGLCVNDTTGLVWVTNESNNTLAVIKMNDFPPLPAVLSNTIPVSSTTDTYVKIINGPAASPSFISPQGIEEVDRSIWFTSHTNTGTLSRIKKPRVTAISAELNLFIPDYSPENLTAADFDVYTSFEGTGGLGNVFGGLKYDRLYSKKLLISDQPAAGGIQKNVLALDPSAATPLSTLVPTQYIQGFPGAGHMGIIPCGMLPQPTINPTAASVTVGPGSTATLTASNCPAPQTYEWKDGSTLVGISASFTTPILQNNKTYTVRCVNGLFCKSSGTAVVVSIGTPITHSIVNCSQASPSNVPFRVGFVGSKPIRVYVNVLLPTTITLNVTGPNFSGTATQTFAAADPNAFIWVNLDYTGAGLAGSRNLTISSSDPTVATCAVTVPILDATKFSFVDCSIATVTGTFVEGINSTGTFTTAISVTTAGSVTINLEEFSNTRMSGVLSTNLTLGQTSITIPFNFNGAGTIAGDQGQFYMSSNDAAGQGPNSGFCYGPTFTVVGANSPCPQNVVISANPALAYAPNALIKASNFIITQVPPAINISTANSNKLTYQAGKSIVLSPGFSVNAGAVFTAKIAGCN